MNNDLLRVFETESDYDSAKDSFVYPTVSYVRDIDEVKYMKLFPNYLYIEALADNCEVGFSDYFSGNEVLCSTDGNTWSTLSDQTEKVVINQGEKLYIKGECEVSYDGYTGHANSGGFAISQPCNVGGNIMSLRFLDDFENIDLTNVECGFSALFDGQPVVSASELLLPATTLTDMCYSYMFRGCTSLVTTPELPATTLSIGCYNRMFLGCESLTAAPELPATTLADNCYQEMFSGCTSLTTAPELPAGTLTRYCYSYMFSSCTNLNYIKMLATDISANDCLHQWVYNVSATGTFVKNPALSVDTIGRGSNGIPEGWTVNDYVAPSGTYLPEYDTNDIDTNFVIGQSYPDVVPVFQSIMNKYNDAIFFAINVDSPELFMDNGTEQFNYPLGGESLFTDYLSRLTYVDASTGTTPIVLIVIDVEQHKIEFANSLEGQPNIYIDLTDGICQEYIVPES